MAKEIEIKLRLSPDHIAKVRAHPLLKELSSTTRTLDSDYYDTEDFALRRRKGAVRIRKSEQGNCFTHKSGGRVLGGLSSRKEYEFPIEGDTLTQGFLTRVDLNVKAVDLSVVFTTHFSREIWLIPFTKETQIECVIDRGVVQCQDKKLDFCEVELELKKGKLDDLYQCAFQFLSDLPLEVENLSKAARGYWLAGKKMESPQIKYFVLGDIGHLTERDTRHLMGKIFSVWQKAQMDLQLENNRKSFCVLREAILDFKRIISKSELAEKYQYIDKLWDQIVTSQHAFQKKTHDKQYNQLLLEIGYYLSTIPKLA